MGGLSTTEGAEVPVGVVGAVSFQGALGCVCFALYGGTIHALRT
jgi:hypothetical protein